MSEKFILPESQISDKPESYIDYLIISAISEFNNFQITPEKESIVFSCSDRKEIITISRFERSPVHFNEREDCYLVSVFESREKFKSSFDYGDELYTAAEIPNVITMFFDTRNKI